MSVDRRTSPAAARALRVLETLAGHPSRGLTLSQLRRELGFSHGNLHAILATMEAAGHVRRDAATKAYTLGPALLAIGAAARRTYPVVDVATPHMEALADELTTECRASMRVGQEILVVARVGPLEPMGIGVTVGERLPLIPPLGLAYLCWSADAEVDAYFAGAAGQLSDEEVAHYRDVMAAIRASGYAINAAVGPPGQRLMETASRILLEASRTPYEDELTSVAHEMGHYDYALIDPDDIEGRRVANISGPVFGPEGSVELMIGVAFVQPRRDKRTVPEVAGRLLTTTRAITQAIGGRPPLPY